MTLADPSDAPTLSIETAFDTLRALEREGLVCSSWCASTAGPARRTYALTPAGLEALHQQAETVEVTHQLLHTFLDRCGRALHPITAASR